MMKGEILKFGFCHNRVTDFDCYIWVKPTDVALHQATWNEAQQERGFDVDLSQPMVIPDAADYEDYSDYSFPTAGK